MKPPETFDIVVAGLWVLLGGYGGLMAYLMRTISSGGKPTFWRAVLEFNAAVSIGVIVVLICAALDWSPLWTGVMVSASGWIGAKGVMSIVEAVLLKRLGLTKQEVEKNP